MGRKATFRGVYCGQVNKPLSSIEEGEGKGGGDRGANSPLKTSKLNSTGEGTSAHRFFKVHPYIYI